MKHQLHKRIDGFLETHGKTALLIFLLLLVIRLMFIDYPLSINGGDGARDYLIAEYILSGEAVLVGPYAGPFTGVLVNSPLYFYLVAALLALHHSVFGLVLISAVLQVFVGFFLFLTARQFFGSIIAATAALSYTLFPNLFITSQFIWQPHLMMVFLSTSLWIGTRGVLQKSFPQVIYSQIFLGLSAVIHFSGLPLLVLATFVLSVWSWSVWRKTWKSVSIGITGFCTFFLGMLPVIPVIITSWQQNPPLHFFLSQVQNNQSNFWEIAQIAVSNFLTTTGFHVHSFPSAGAILNLVFLGLMVLGLIRYTSDKKSGIFVGLLVGILLTHLLFLTVFKQPLIIHYLHPALLTFSLLTPALVIRALQPLSQSKVLVLATCALLLIVMSSSFKAFQKTRNLSQYASVTAATKVLVQKLETSNSNPLDPNQEESESLAFPTLVSLRTHGHLAENAILLIPLSKELNTPLSLLEKQKLYTTYATLSSEESVLLVCYNHFGEVYPKDDCVQDFSSRYPEKESRNELFSDSNLTLFLLN